MTKTEYAEYLQSEDWQQRRKQAIIAAHHQCEQCNLPRWVAELVYDQDLNVHHRSYEHLGNEPPRDLEALCRRCHEIEKFGRSDLKKPKTAKCSSCGDEHFNTYSDHCNFCEVVLSGHLHYGLHFKNKDGKPWWPQLIYYGIILDEIDPSELSNTASMAIPERDRYTQLRNRQRSHNSASRL